MRKSLICVDKNLINTGDKSKDVDYLLVLQIVSPYVQGGIAAIQRQSGCDAKAIRRYNDNQAAM